MSGLQKLLVIVLVIGAGAYFAAEWKIERDVKREFDKLRPWVSVTFDRASLKPSGEISISGVLIRPNMLDLSFPVGEVAWSYGNVLQTLFGTYGFTPDKLPEKVSLRVEDFELPLQRLGSAMPEDTTRNSVDIIAAAACGERQRLGIDEMVDMGYDIHSLSFGVTVQNNAQQDVATVHGFFEIENMSRIDYEGLVDKRLSARVNSLEHPLEALQSLELVVHDIGYNQVKTTFCAREAGVSNAEYIELHVQQAAALLRSVDITPAPELITAYENYLKSGSALMIKTRPEPNVRFSDLAFYDFQAIQNMLRLEVAVNGNAVTQFFENWHTERFMQIAKVQNDSLPMLESKPASVDRAIVRAAENEPAETASKTFRITPVSDAHKFLDVQVLVIRNTGKNYAGTLVRVQDDKIWINVSQVGEAVIPVAVSSIAEFQVLRD